MSKRFFKLIYVIALICLALSLPIVILNSVQWDKIVVTSYKAKCTSNNQYVVLQGASVGNAEVYSETYLDSENSMAIKEQLNFYCKYYEAIQPHILSYNMAKTTSEQLEANMNYREFENSVAKTYAYPELFKFEEVSEETHLEELYYPLIQWLIGAVAVFVLLQILRICYVYVVFGKVVWHPFK